MSSGVTNKCPAYSAFFGAMGATAAVVFSGKFYSIIIVPIVIERFLSIVKPWALLMVQQNQVVVFLPWPS